MKNQRELPEPKQLSSEELAEIAERVRVWHSNEGHTTSDFNVLLSHIAWLEARTAAPPSAQDERVEHVLANCKAALLTLPKDALGLDSQGGWSYRDELVGNIDKALLSIVGQPESSTAHLTKDVKQEDQDSR